MREMRGFFLGMAFVMLVLQLVAASREGVFKLHFSPGNLALWVGLVVLWTVLIGGSHRQEERE